jgi:hypothetical protein
MRSSSLLAAVFWGVAISAMSGAEDGVTPSVDTVQSAFDRFAYLKWLKTERPELYSSVNYRPRPRRAAVSR